MWWISFCLYSLLFIWSSGLKVFEHSLSSTDYKLFYHRTADFGPEKYNVSGQLTLMQPLKGCNIEQYKIDENNYQQIYEGEIVLILRGNCTFSKKVHHSQLLGASGVIIGDYNTSNGEEWIVMSKDSSDGYDIYIPSVFVPHNTYQWIYRLLLSYNNTDDDVVYAMLDTEGEYVAPSSAFWLAAFGIVIIIIPTLWCFIVCMALLRKKIINYVQRSRRSQYLSTIPIILYKGKGGDDATKEEIGGSSSKTPPPNSIGIGLSVITTKISSKDKGEECITTSYAKLEENDEEEKDDINDIDKTKIMNMSENIMGTNKDKGVIKNMSQFLLSQFRAQKECVNPHNDACAICLDDFTANEELRLLPCNHGFHIKCIDPWLSKSSELCPICKQSIFINDSNSNSYGCCPSILKICCIPTSQQNQNDDDNDDEGQQEEEEQGQVDDDSNIDDEDVDNNGSNNDIESDTIVLRSSVDSDSDDNSQSPHHNDQDS